MAGSPRSIGDAVLMARRAEIVLALGVATLMSYAPRGSPAASAEAPRAVGQTPAGGLETSQKSMWDARADATAEWLVLNLRPLPAGSGERYSARQAGVLSLRCLAGVTEAVLETRPTTGGDPSRSRGRRTAPTSIWHDRVLLFVFEDFDYVEVYDHNPQPNDHRIYLPEPFDLAGKLRRHDELHLFVFDPKQYRGWEFAERLVRSSMRGDRGARPVARYRLEGLDELLGETGDPCGWRRS